MVTGFVRAPPVLRPRLDRIAPNRPGVPASKRIVVLSGLAADAGEAAFRGLVLGAQADGAGIAAGGLGFVAKPLIGKATGDPGLAVPRIRLHRLVEVGGGLLGFADGEVAERAAEQRLGLLRRQAVGRGEILDGEFMLLFALVEQGAIVIGLGIVGAKADRLVEILQRFAGLLHCLVNHAPAKIGGGVAGIEGDGTIVISHCLIETVGLAVDQRAIGEGLATIGIETDRLVEIGERLLGLAGLRQNRAAHVVGLRIVRVVLDRLGERADVVGGRDLRGLLLVGFRWRRQRRQ